MRNSYKPPVLKVHGTVEEITGIVGDPANTDSVLINGNVVDETLSDQELECTFVNGSQGTLVYSGSFEDQCADAIDEYEGMDNW